MKQAAKGPAGVTEQLADFIVGTSYDKLPGAAVDKVKTGLVDFIGVSLAGSVQDAGQKITSFVKGLGGKAQSSVIGGGYRTSPTNAALVNGTIGHALDYDDSYHLTHLHPSAPLAPAPSRKEAMPLPAVRLVTCGFGPRVNPLLKL